MARISILACALLLMAASCELARDSSIVSAFESRYRSMTLRGCGGFDDQSFMVCRGPYFSEVSDEIQAFIPDLKTTVEVSGCGYGKSFNDQKKIFKFDISEAYGDVWTDRTCLIQILAKTKVDGGRRAFYEANILLYGHDDRYLPTPGKEDHFQKCDIRFTDKGRTDIDCKSRRE